MCAIRGLTNAFAQPRAAPHTDITYLIYRLNV